MGSLLFGIITLELITIAGIDIKTKRISNFWSFLNIGFFILLVILKPEIYPFEIRHFLFPLGFLILGFLLFNLKIMGAGDSKLLSSLFLITPQNLHSTLLENVLYATIITGTIFFIMALIKNWKSLASFAMSAHWKGIVEVIKSKFSYAPVVAIAWILLGVKK